MQGKKACPREPPRGFAGVLRECGENHAPLRPEHTRRTTLSGRQAPARSAGATPEAEDETPQGRSVMLAFHKSTQTEPPRIQRGGTRYPFDRGIGSDFGHLIEEQRFLRRLENPVPDFTAMIEAQYLG